MPDIMSLVTGAITAVKKLREATKMLKDADTKNTIADLSMALADLKMQIVELQEDNMRLRKDLEEAHKEVNFRENVSLREGVYYLNQPVQGRPEGPYCPRCFDVDNRLVLLTAFKGGWKDFGEFNCPNCQACY